MDLGLAGKTAVVTGSSHGIGRAIARALIAEGCRVVANGRDPARLAETAAAEGMADHLAADVSRPDGAAALVDFALARCGAIDILVCNAGSGRSVPPGEETPAEWQRVLAVNLDVATNMVAAARPALERSRGAIVCISSIAGMAALGAPVAYSAAKAALNAYVRGIARPLASAGVRINAVAPGNTDFPGSTWERRRRDDPDALARMLDADVALGRLGCAEEIADVVAFVASPRASFMTGTVVVVDGGQLRS